VNLLLKLAVRMNLVRHDNFLGERLGKIAFRFNHSGYGLLSPCRYGACVGFCITTRGVTRAPSYEGYVFSAKDAAFNCSLGHRPRSRSGKIISAESAIHLRVFFGNHSPMPQSLSKVIIHIIFSTKDRESWLDADVRPRMHAYVATICRDLNAEVLRVGGVADHLHIVTTLPRTLSQADMVETLKKTSSKWIKGLNAKYRQFYWQRGYGAFSVSPSQLEAVLEYVENQKEHHRTRSFQEEYRDFLCKHGVEFDERYVWN
jgi:putative transposase